MPDPTKEYGYEKLNVDEDTIVCDHPCTLHTVNFNGMTVVGDVTVYDAAFVALAEQLETDLITADEKMARQLRAMPRICYLADIVF